MFSSNEILNFNEENFNLFFIRNEIEELIKPILIDYPDYYNLRGVDIKSLSKSKKDQVKRILKNEQNII